MYRKILCHIWTEIFSTIISLFLLFVCVCRLVCQIEPQNLLRSQLGAKCRWSAIFENYNPWEEGQCVRDTLHCGFSLLLQPHLQKVEHIRAGRRKIVGYWPPLHALLISSGFIGCVFGTQPSMCVRYRVHHFLQSHAKWKRIGWWRRYRCDHLLPKPLNFVLKFHWCPRPVASCNFLHF